MKYLYQLLAAFFLLTIVIMSIIGITFTQLTKRTIEENNYSQLSHYAESIIQTQADYKDNPYFSQGSLNEQIINTIGITEHALKSQGVQFAFINPKQQAEYPLLSADQLAKLLSNQEFNTVKKQGELRKTLDSNLAGKSVPTAYVFKPLYEESGQLIGIIAIAQSIQHSTNYAKLITTDLLKGLILSAIIALILSYLLARIQEKKVNTINHALKEVADGDFSIQLPEKGNQDEFNQLAHSFNSMTLSLNESSEEIKRQEELRKQFMADASHEMKTPLTTIKGLLEGLKYDAIPETQKKNAIQLMEKETDRMIRLIKENLDYERIRANQITINRQIFDATAVLNQISSQLQAKANEVNDSLAVLTTEKVLVYADYDRFTQIMVNLLQNAIQFTTAGTIEVRLATEPTKTVITISDTGIGMNRDQVKNIWERYYKVDPSRTNKKNAESGLGLAIVQQLMALHQGTIDVTSQLGQGTTFSLQFPNPTDSKSAEER